MTANLFTKYESRILSTFNAAAVYQLHQTCDTDICPITTAV